MNNGAKPRIATCSLAGCFGCHMSILDIDSRFCTLIERVEFNRSPVTDIKTFTERCAVGIVEGGCSNEENVHVLKDFRENCDILVALGECSVMGGIPALRNNIPLQECLDEAFVNGIGCPGEGGQVPDDPELPLLLDRVYPCREVVKIDYCIPGCPPSADCIWECLLAILENREADLSYPLIRYD